MSEKVTSREAIASKKNGSQGTGPCIDLQRPDVLSDWYLYCVLWGIKLTN